MYVGEIPLQQILYTEIYKYTSLTNNQNYCDLLWKGMTGKMKTASKHVKATWMGEMC